MWAKFVLLHLLYSLDGEDTLHTHGPFPASTWLGHYSSFRRQTAQDDQALQTQTKVQQLSTNVNVRLQDLHKHYSWSSFFFIPWPTSTDRKSVQFGVFDDLFVLNHLHESAKPRPTHDSNFGSMLDLAADQLGQCFDFLEWSLTETTEYAFITNQELQIYRQTTLSRTRWYCSRYQGWNT